MLIWGYRDLVFVGIDPEGAAIAKRPVLLIRLICSLITALVVISAITAVGVILVIGLLCAPVLMHVERSRSLKTHAAQREHGAAALWWRNDAGDCC